MEADGINKNSNMATSVAFILGIIGLISVMSLDKFYWRTGLLSEGWPIFTLGHLIRCILVFFFTLAVFWSLIGNNNKKLTLNICNGETLNLLYTLGALILAALLLFLFIFETSFFNAISMEDSPIEWGSFSLLFVSSIITAISFFKIRNNAIITKATKLSITLLSLLFFLIAMEEVSWFQRLLEIETPQLFDRNGQNELNLHNFATNYTENLYYFGAFLFLVVLPFIRLLFPYVSKNNYLRILIPRPFIVVIGSIACAYNFDMWNIIFTQIAFFGSVVILILFVAFSIDKNERYLISFTIFLMVTTQVLFLVKGDNFARIWEITEYKEMLIPLGFCIYSFDMFTCLNRIGDINKTSIEYHC